MDTWKAGTIVRSGDKFALVDWHDGGRQQLNESRYVRYNAAPPDRLDMKALARQLRERPTNVFNRAKTAPTTQDMDEVVFGESNPPQIAPGSDEDPKQVKLFSDGQFVDLEKRGY